MWLYTLSTKTLLLKTANQNATDMLLSARELRHYSYFYSVKVLIYVIVTQNILHKTNESVSEVMNLGWSFFSFFFANTQSFVFWFSPVLNTGGQSLWNMWCQGNKCLDIYFLSSVEDNFQWYASGGLLCLWRHTALLVINESEYEMLFYKSIHWTPLFKVADFREQVYQVMSQEKESGVWQQAI